MELSAKDALTLDALAKFIMDWKTAGADGKENLASAFSFGSKAMKLLTDSLPLLKACCKQFDTPPEIEVEIDRQITFVKDLKLNNESLDVLGGYYDYQVFTQDLFIATLANWITNLRKGQNSLTAKERVANASYELAAQQLAKNGEKDMTDKNAYQYLANYGPNDLELASYPTWVKHLQNARRKMGALKYNKRGSIKTNVTKASDDPGILKEISTKYTENE